MNCCGLRAKTLFLCGFCLPVLLAGCGDAASRSVSASASTTTSAPSFESRVKPARASFVYNISRGLQKGINIADRAYMVKATRFDNLHYVVLRLQTPDMDDYAVWAISGKDVSGAPLTLLSADNLAASISRWPKGEPKGAWVGKDPDVSDLKQYASSRK